MTDIPALSSRPLRTADTAAQARTHHHEETAPDDGATPSSFANVIATLLSELTNKPAQPATGQTKAGPPADKATSPEITTATAQIPAITPGEDAPAPGIDAKAASANRSKSHAAHQTGVPSHSPATEGPTTTTRTPSRKQQGDAPRHSLFTNPPQPKAAHVLASRRPDGTLPNARANIAVPGETGPLGTGQITDQPATARLAENPTALAPPLPVASAGKQSPSLAAGTSAGQPTGTSPVGTEPKASHLSGGAIPQAVPTKTTIPPLSTLDSAATAPGAPTAPPDAAKTLHATRASTNAGAALKGIPAGKQNEPLPNGTDTPAFNLTPITDPTGAIKPGPALPTAASLRPDLAHHAAQQIASTISHSAPGQPVVLRLNPDELGHVRLALHTVDGAVSLAIHVERGDTLDLMRRHIGQLATAFREIGYSDVAFSFSSSERDHSHPQPSTPAADALISEITGEHPPTQAETDSAPRLQPMSGLDLRF